MDLNEYENRVRAILARRLTTACAVFVTELKTVLSVPAPRVRTKSGRYRATTPATPGAPPRKITGRLRASVTFVVDKELLIGYVGTNVDYGAYNERRGHPWLMPTYRRLRPRLVQIMSGRSL